MDRNTLEVDRIVDRSLEFLRAERQGEHRLLGLAHSQIDGGRLQHMLGILRRETQYLFAIHNHFAQAVSDFDNTVFGFLFANRIEIDAARHA